MKKNIHIILLLLITTPNLRAQSFASIEEIFRFAVRYHMEVNPYPDLKGALFLRALDKTHYIAISLPDSCIMERTFPKETFSNYRFCPKDDIPFILKCRARKAYPAHHRRSSPRRTHRLFPVSYFQSGKHFNITIKDTRVARDKGRCVCVLSGWTKYDFIYDETTHMWTVEKITPGGP